MPSYAYFTAGTVYLFFAWLGAEHRGDAINMTTIMCAPVAVLAYVAFVAEVFDVI